MNQQIRSSAVAAVVLLFAWSTPAFALDPAPKCEAGKLKTAGKYGACRLGAESKAVKKGEAPDYSKCEAKFADKWSKAEAKAGSGVCPSEGDEESMEARIATDTAEIATLLSGGTPAECGDGVINAVGEQCDGADLGAATCESLGHSGGTLACDTSCDFDASGCSCTNLGGVLLGAACWFFAEAGDSCDDTCNGLGLLYDEATRTYAGSDGSAQNCAAVLDAVGAGGINVTEAPCSDGFGCLVESDVFRTYCSSPTTNSTAGGVGTVQRACACTP